MAVRRASRSRAPLRKKGSKKRKTPAKAARKKASTPKRSAAKRAPGIRTGKRKAASRPKTATRKSVVQKTKRAPTARLPAAPATRPAPTTAVAAPKPVVSGSAPAPLAARPAASSSPALGAPPSARPAVPLSPKPTPAAGIPARPGQIAAAAPQLIGRITHYYTHVNAGVLQIEEGEIAVGDTVHIRGHTTDFYQRLEHLEIDHIPVQRARVGQEVAFTVSQRVREHDQVYRVSR